MLFVAAVLFSLVRCSARPGGRHLIGADQVSSCANSINHWADQRLEAARLQLQQEHGIYRADGAGANAITQALLWVDDRIIDQKLAEERRQIRAIVLKSSGCLPQFQP